MPTYKDTATPKDEQNSTDLQKDHDTQDDSKAQGQNEKPSNPADGKQTDAPRKKNPVPPIFRKRRGLHKPFTTYMDPEDYLTYREYVKYGKEIQSEWREGQRQLDDIEIQVLVNKHICDRLAGEPLFKEWRARQEATNNI